jgi:hypothetical protein
MTKPQTSVAGRPAVVNTKIYALERKGPIMPRFTRLTPATAVGASRDLLSDLVSRHGQVVDMVAMMAHSPAVLGGYLQLSRAMKRAKLNRKVSERISIAVQAQQGCGQRTRSNAPAQAPRPIPQVP